MMEAIWGTDYDMHTDKCYKRPSCPKCEEPIGKYEDGKYRCYSCGEVVDVTDKKMQEWLRVMEETKEEYGDCPRIKSKGKLLKMGCGGKNCVKKTYVHNPVTLDWQVAWGVCTKCGMRFIV